MTTAARARRLARLTGPDGVIAVLAADHRDSLRVVLEPDHPESVSDEELRAIKVDLAGACDDSVTGIMLDPAVGMDAEVVVAVPPEIGIIAALEAQGYLADESVTHTTLLDGWSAATAASCGADVAKLLALWTGDESSDQRRVVDAAVEDAHTAGMPLVLEPLPRGLASTGPWVVDWADAHRDTGADLFKLPHPGSADRCRALTEMLPAPWVLLSAGAGFDEFADQLTTAVDSGAAGYIVGRAVWREAAVRDPDARRRALDELVTPRLATLRERCRR